MPVDKSLKYFVRESSIKKEVDQWDFEDCEFYIQKHKYDTKQSKLLKKKIDIVKKRQSDLINKAGAAELARYFTTPKLDENMKKIIVGCLSGLCESFSSQDRKHLFSNWSDEDVYMFGPRLAPKECLDSSYKNWKKMCEFKNTGVYLWARGYNVTKPLGCGGFGAVWECDGKAVKIIPKGGIGLQLEVMSAKAMEKLIRDDKSGKAKKYFNYLISTGDNSPILEGVLAKSDLYGAAKKRILSGKAESKKSTKTIQTLLRQLIQVCKSLILLHELGYSHNDVKPENFFKVDKAVIAASAEGKKSSGDKKVHKTRTQLADFGGISKIPQNKQEEEYQKIHPSPVVHSKEYSPDNIMIALDTEAIEKRDVFALGASGVVMLLSKIPRANVQYGLPKQIIAKTNEEIYTMFKLNEYYGGTSKENMFAFLDTMRKMMDQNYHSRPTLEESLQMLKSVKYEK